MKRKTDFEKMFEKNTNQTLSIIKYIIETEINYDRDTETQHVLTDKQHGGKEKCKVYPLTDEDILAIYAYEKRHLRNSKELCDLIYMIKRMKRRIAEEDSQ